MPYCTLDDITVVIPEAELIQLTDDTGDGVLNQAMVDAAVADAAAEIDTYCGKRYVVPFADPAPAVIRKVTVDVAVYNIYSRRDVGGIPDARTDRYKAGIALLTNIAKGVVSIGEATAAQAVTAASPRLFDRHSMRGF